MPCINGVVSGSPPSLQTWSCATRHFGALNDSLRIPDSVIQKRWKLSLGRRSDGAPQTISKLLSRSECEDGVNVLNSTEIILNSDILCAKVQCTYVCNFTSQRLLINKNYGPTGIHLICSSYVWGTQIRLMQSGNGQPEKTFNRAPFDLESTPNWQRNVIIQSRLIVALSKHVLPRISRLSKMQFAYFFILIICIIITFIKGRDCRWPEWDKMPSLILSSVQSFDIFFSYKHLFLFDS